MKRIRRRDSLPWFAKSYYGRQLLSNLIVDRGTRSHLHTALTHRGLLYYYHYFSSRPRLSTILPTFSSSSSSLVPSHHFTRLFTWTIHSQSYAQQHFGISSASSPLFVHRRWTALLGLSLASAVALSTLLAWTNTHPTTAATSTFTPTSTSPPIPSSIPLPSLIPIPLSSHSSSSSSSNPPSTASLPVCASSSTSSSLLPPFPRTSDVHSLFLSLHSLPLSSLLPLLPSLLSLSISLFQQDHLLLSSLVHLVTKQLLLSNIHQLQSSSSRATGVDTTVALRQLRFHLEELEESAEFIFIRNMQDELLPLMLNFNGNADERADVAELGPSIVNKELNANNDSIPPITAEGNANATATGVDGWTLLSTQQGVSTYYRPSSDSHAHSFKVIGNVDSNIFHLLVLLNEVDLYSQFLYPLTYSHKQLLPSSISTTTASKTLTQTSAVVGTASSTPASLTEAAAAGAVPLSRMRMISHLVAWLPPPFSSRDAVLYVYGDVLDGKVGIYMTSIAENTSSSSKSTDYYKNNQHHESRDGSINHQHGILDDEQRTVESDISTDTLLSPYLPSPLSAQHVRATVTSSSFLLAPLSPSQTRVQAIFTADPHLPYLPHWLLNLMCARFSRTIIDLLQVQSYKVFGVDKLLEEGVEEKMRKEENEWVKKVREQEWLYGEMKMRLEKGGQAC